MNYCHECGEYALKFDLRKRGFSPLFQSVPADKLFVLTQGSTVVKVSVYDMTVTTDSKTITCKDWSILIKEVLANLYP